MSNFDIDSADDFTHDLPPIPSQATLLDNAANPLGILAEMEQASIGLGPKLFAGGASCMLISGLLNPMDVIKVRLQTQPPALPGETVKYRNFTHALKTIFQEEGYRRGLMRGFTPSMMREASYSSMRMGFYDTVKILIAPKSTSKDEFTLGQKMAAGCISGAMGSVIATPTDLVKIRFQGYSLLDPNPYPHSFAAFSALYSAGGIRSLYRGATPTIARAAILTGSQLASYDHSKLKGWVPNYFRLGPHFILSLPLAEFIRVKLGAESF